MAITVNLRYTGRNGNARKFAEEMTAGGTVAAIRAEAGNLRYEYYQSLDDPETVLLVPDDGHNRGAAGEVRSAHDRGKIYRCGNAGNRKPVYQEINRQEGYTWN